MPSNVPLRMAFEWTCPDCGTDHFERAIAVEMAPEDKVHMREAYGIDDAQTGDFLMSPEEVVCPDCGRGFSACDPSDEDEDSQ